MDFYEKQVDPYYNSEKEKITTTIPIEVKKDIDERGYAYNELILLGLLAKKGNPQLIERIQMCETEIERVKRIIRMNLTNNR